MCFYSSFQTHWSVSRIISTVTMRSKVKIPMKKKVEVKEVKEVPSQFGLGIQEDTKSDSDSD